MSPPQRAALLMPVACYPLVYYVVLYMPRYRRPLEWVVLLLAGAAAWRWMGRSRSPTWSASEKPLGAGK